MVAENDDSVTWAALRSKLTVSDDGGHTCPLPTDADLDRFEADSGYRLPAGYRGFIKVFGPGVLLVGDAGLRCSAPYCVNPVFNLGGAPRMREWARNLPAASTPNDRLFCFADDDGGHQYGWDPDDPTDRDAPEFRMYARPRWTFNMAVPMSHTFEGFIRLFTNQKVFRTRMRADPPYRDVKDPRFGYFTRSNGSAITGPRGSSLVNQFIPANHP